eukprot:CAMPEP_0170646712 /NCGR_PEP_ID=MMETSP0224-20130122/43786_1 /TAXON_ID=285029 /ORGANISM="Togula jolla, Strain CCCM 725" /LENGTH=83 /DNA_ID=CAMNT_0010978067 /DNA_START=162 /DNA_END=412 /DNA_ORIENTATION=+
MRLLADPSTRKVTEVTAAEWAVTQDLVRPLVPSLLEEELHRAVTAPSHDLLRIRRGVYAAAWMKSSSSSRSSANTDVALVHGL